MADGYVMEIYSKTCIMPRTLTNIIVMLILYVVSTPGISAQSVNDASATTSGVSGHTVWALGTNMLADAALIPNIAVEAALGDRWSVAASWSGAWWGSRSKVWRLYGGEVEGSYWFGGRNEGVQRPFTGHHAGLFCGAVTYDFKTGRYGYQSPGVTWVAGMSYGYGLSIGKRLRLDLSVSIGYMTGRRDKYEDECGRWVYADRRRIRYFGPLKVEVGLVWIIGSTKS